MTEREKRRAALRADEERLHDLYMATEIGSQDERALELALEEIMVELDAIAEQFANDPERSIAEQELARLVARLVREIQ